MFKESETELERAEFFGLENLRESVKGLYCLCKF